MRTLQKSPKSLAALAVALLLAFASACSTANTSADSAKSGSASDKDSSVISDVTSMFSQKTYEVPAGTNITVRLNQSLSSAVSQAGDEYTATLDSPIVVDNRTLAPSGTPVKGLVTHAQESGKVKGKAELVLSLKSIAIDGKDYPLDVHSLTLRASDTHGKDAAEIAGGAILGAVIGAITGGGKGAAVGAGVGGGAGTGYVLLTKGKKVELGRETRIQFRLEKPVELPQANG